MEIHGNVEHTIYLSAGILRKIILNVCRNDVNIFRYNEYLTLTVKQLTQAGKLLSYTGKFL